MTMDPDAQGLASSVGVGKLPQVAGSAWVRDFAISPVSSQHALSSVFS